MTHSAYVEIDGYCPISSKSTKFVAKRPWLRGALICTTCKKGSVPRERALAIILERRAPNWREQVIHESSPSERGISLKLREQCRNYVGSHYYPNHPFGTVVKGFRNEDIENQTFPDNAFDLVITLDVFEHVFQPGAMTREIFRTLKPGGLYICTFPIRPYQVKSHQPRVKKAADGTLEHLEEPEIHGNPISGDGALVTFDYGYEIHKMIPHWAPFEVEITRFNKRSAGVLGEYTEVIVCTKPDA
ncbi:MAG: class I SAM-dependent methyltransferase [Acidiferrobacterales bacterium]|nr:class I SAM-dependent methyltransferase [Acidiferrobacterales bacterium]